MFSFRKLSNAYLNAFEYPSMVATFIVLLFYAFYVYFYSPNQSLHCLRIFAFLCVQFDQVFVTELSKNV